MRGRKGTGGCGEWGLEKAESFKNRGFHEKARVLVEKWGFHRLGVKKGGFSGKMEAMSGKS